MCRFSKIFLKSAKSLHPNLQVHPAVHHAVLPREPHLLVVQHGHLERLELNPLLDEAAPLAVDLPGRVPDLLDVGVHLDDDDVGDNGRHLGRGGGGGGEEGGKDAVLLGVGQGRQGCPTARHGDGEGRPGDILSRVEISVGGEGKEKRGVQGVFVCNMGAVFFDSKQCFLYKQYVYVLYTCFLKACKDMYCTV